MKTASETCDDNNTISLDGCSNLCQIENGWTCVSTTMPSVCTPKCGDGIFVQGEICDDGNTSDADKCLGNCTGPVPGYSCLPGTLLSPSTCIEVCGDSILTPS